MSALQFLGKKSWHVGTKKNEERVWLREQAAEKEAARVAELQKQLDEERKLEEVRRLERESGRGGPAPAARVDWMYEGPGAAMPETADAVKMKVAAASAAQEDALLGKKEAVLRGSVSASAAGVEAVAPKKGTSGDVDDDSIRQELVLRDAEAKLREDPLLSIRRREIEARDNATARGLRVQDGQVPVLNSRGGILKRPRTETLPPLGAQESRRRAEKEARKAERARIREERRDRRSRRNRREEIISERGSQKRKRGLDQASDAPEPFDKRPCRVSPSGGSVIVVDRKDDVLLESENRGTPVENKDLQRERNEYGLLVPKGGTKVAVQTNFDAKSQRRFSENLNVRHSHHRARPRSSAERAERIAEMQANAEKLDRDRARRIERFRNEEEAECAQQSVVHDVNEAGPTFMREFSRDAMRKAELDGVGARLRQRQPSLHVDDD